MLTAAISTKSENTRHASCLCDRVVIVLMMSFLLMIYCLDVVLLGADNQNKSACVFTEFPASYRFDSPLGYGSV
jgi:hypothetical protein